MRKLYQRVKCILWPPGMFRASFSNISTILNCGCLCSKLLHYITTNTQHLLFSVSLHDITMLVFLTIDVMASELIAVKVAMPPKTTCFAEGIAKHHWLADRVSTKSIVSIPDLRIILRRVLTRCWVILKIAHCANNFPSNRRFSWLDRS